jgi:nucleotide-binding universal stress UspA family protein
MESEGILFTKIAVALDESPESERALIAAIQLAKALGARLQTVTVMADLPVYTAYATAADPSIIRTLDGDRGAFYERLQLAAKSTALQEGIELTTHLLDGEKVDGIVAFVHKHQINLLVIGLHHRSLRMSRLWSTVYTLAQGVPCSMLGVH